MYVLLIVVCRFVLFLLAIVLSVLLRYTVSDYPFGIFKLFLTDPIVWYFLFLFILFIQHICLFLLLMLIALFTLFNLSFYN